MRKIDLIVIHCADTFARMDIGVKEIREWHLKRGFNDIGYHYVIRRDGTVENGRPLEKAGAHAQGYNSRSVGICYAGGKGDDGRPEDNRTPEQKATLQKLVAELLEQFPDAEVCGHRDLPGVNKECPCFSVAYEFANKK
ncbi:MAG: lysozyme [Odoribacter splanchnicus]|nr:lysozyme [Odoribacter splanchnicus]